jgi:tetratricopeptide (TPR) repeat protein
VLASSPERQLDIGEAWCNAGDLDRARPSVDRAVELARRSGAAGRLPNALWQAAWLDAETGRWSQALANACQALDLARATGQPYLACAALVTMAGVEAGQGRDEDCLLHAREAGKLAGELGLRPLQLLARRSQALLEFSRGRIQEALTCYEEVRRLAARWQILHPYYSPIPDLIELYAQAGALNQAQELLAEFLAQVPGNANPLPAARVARCRGILAGDSFDTDFLEALALHERTWPTGSGYAGPSGGETRASSSAPQPRSSIISTPAPGQTGPAPNSAPAARPSPAPGTAASNSPRKNWRSPCSSRRDGLTPRLARRYF